MKKIKEIRLTVTYTVSLKEAEVSTEVFNQLNFAIDNGDKIDGHPFYYKAMDYMKSNVKESDCLDWRVEIDDLILPNNR